MKNSILQSRLMSLVESIEHPNLAYREALRTDDIGAIRSLDYYLRPIYEDRTEDFNLYWRTFLFIPAELNARKTAIYLIDKYVPSFERNIHNTLIRTLVIGVENDSYNYLDSMILRGYLDHLSRSLIIELIRSIAYEEVLQNSIKSYKLLMSAILANLDKL